MKILNIHGYHGSAENSAKKALDLLPDVEVISPTINYDLESPKSIFNYLKDFFYHENFDGFVGTSLGGFFAACLCNYFEIPTVLINPALLPEALLPTLGYKRVGGIAEFRDLNFEGMRGLDLRYISTVIGTDDEVIPTLDHTRAALKNSRFIEVDGGKHSGSTLNLDELFRVHRKEWFDDIIERSVHF